VGLREGVTQSFIADSLLFQFFRLVVIIRETGQDSQDQAREPWLFAAGKFS
jgi:hypothetical protein